MPPPYPMAPTPPWGVPRVIDLAFWGGLYGILFGLALPRLRGPYWVNGLILGVIAALIGFFVVAPLKGMPVGGGWQVSNWERSLLINGCWGIGVGVILPLILPRSLRYVSL
jgi:tetrahydromethanopterin S-methyltransferase subunit C